MYLVINYYLTQHMVQKLIAFSEGKNDPRDLLLFFFYYFLSFYYLKFPEMTSPTWCYYRSANYTASRSSLQWNCVERLFVCLFVKHLFNVPGSRGILVNDRYKLLLWNKMWWESACNARDQGSISGLGRAPGEANGNPLQYSFLEHPPDRGAWRATVRGVAKSWTQLRD